MKPAKTILIEWDRHGTLNERQMELAVMAMEEYASQFKDKSVTELNERNSSVDEGEKSFLCIEEVIFNYPKCTTQCKNCSEYPGRNDFRARKFCP